MVLDVVITNESKTIVVSDPFRIDLDGVCRQIEEFARSKGGDIAGLDVKGLIPRMIKGIAGCEDGCPADAKGLVSRGYEGFELQYIEGGILSACSKLKDGRSFYLKMFPDF